MKHVSLRRKDGLLPAKKKRVGLIIEQPHNKAPRRIPEGILDRKVFSRHMAQFIDLWRKRDFVWIVRTALPEVNIRVVPLAESLSRIVAGTSERIEIGFSEEVDIFQLPQFRYAPRFCQ